jgi:AcrR family transcriptional regulator
MSAKRPSYHHGDLRRALLDATLSIAAKAGAPGVSLREVARAAGVSQTAPYRHFHNKLAMLAAASEEGFRLLSAQMREAASEKPGESSATSEGEIGEWAAAYVRFAIDHEPHFRLMFGQGSPAKASTDALQEAAAEAFSLLSQVAGDWCAAHDSADLDPRQLALRIWSVGHGLANLAIEGQTRFLDLPTEAVPAVARQTVQALLVGLRVSRPRRPGH